jgi:hypothetical protein
MAEYKAFIPGVKVSGKAIFSVLEAMKGFDANASELLEKNGIKYFINEGWYPQQAWLNTLKDIADKMGEVMLFNIGKAILSNVKLPPGIESIEKGLCLIDVAYHMNYRLNGKIMFDPFTGIMTEGIGHYVYEKTGEKSGKVIGLNPMPCEYSRGFITAMTRHFQPLSEVILDSNVKNKKDGEDSSTYIITW